MTICPECAMNRSNNCRRKRRRNQSNSVMPMAMNELKDGDTVTVIKDLKVKGSS